MSSNRYDCLLVEESVNYLLEFITSYNQKLKFGPFQLCHCPGAPLMIHPGANEASPFAILDILESCGADISRTVIGHMDRTVLRDEALLSLARRGAWLEYDLLGIEVSHYQVIRATSSVIL